ncbi:MAG: hypothetical protein EA360_06460 [Balneolaceae bacterium]|nr:MAG: hypothetical protein EA360_06460 [Balneolaceae bacterium]
MTQQIHQFHIPVMGTGHSIDSPIRIAHLGIDSVVSVVDDLLCEKIREYYSSLYEIPFEPVTSVAEDGRARRITAYLDLMAEIVSEKFTRMKELPLFENSEKDRYFQLLPDSSELKKGYVQLKASFNSGQVKSQIDLLTSMMRAGSIDVNIMAKVDALRNDRQGKPLSAAYSDASAALRGYAKSTLSSSLVLSAGFNPRLYGYLEEFRDFYRDQYGVVKKKIILKVSDFRSAMIQGKFLAKKGLEIAEFRIESGLNCGGHAFVSDGHLMPVLLKEFKEKKEQLAAAFQPLIRSYYESKGWVYPVADDSEVTPAITVQGGIGNHGEVLRLTKEYEMDATGWGSPFLLVPEAVCVDDETTELLEKAGEKDLYLSNVSPLGVPFNNVRGSGAEVYTKKMIEQGYPGSKCPKKFLVTNTEFTEHPICTASSQYQLLKISQINESGQTGEKKSEEIGKVLEKSCLCTNLGAGALIKLGIMNPSYGRQEVCPGPNIAWFNRTYTLEEMVDHIYGRGESLVPKERPHMFAKECMMYVDYLEEMMGQLDSDAPEMKKLLRMKKNLDQGMDLCLEIADGEAYPGENLDSLRELTLQQKERLETLFSNL